MMGNHEFLVGANYSSYDDWLIYQVSYAYKKFRPQFYFYFNGRNDDYYYNDADLGNSHIKRMRYSEEMVVSYPLDASDRIELGIVTAEKVERNRTKNDEVSKNRENGASISLVRDTTKWKFLDMRSGARTNFTAYQAKEIWGGTYDYREYILDSQRFFTIMKNEILAFRFLGISSEGKDKQLYSLPVRGISRSEYKNNKNMLLTGEGRFFIFSRINYYMWYMLPDLYIKSLQAIVFTDTGINWDKDETFRNTQISDLKNSVGSGLRLNTFILQRFPLFFELDGIRRTDKEKWEAVFSVSFNRPF